MIFWEGTAADIAKNLLLTTVVYPYVEYALKQAI